MAGLFNSLLNGAGNVTLLEIFGLLVSNDGQHGFNSEKLFQGLTSHHPDIDTTQARHIVSVVIQEALKDNFICESDRYYTLKENVNMLTLGVGFPSSAIMTQSDISWCLRECNKETGFNVEKLSQTIKGYKPELRVGHSRRISKLLIAHGVKSNILRTSDIFYKLSNEFRTILSSRGLESDSEED
ncbi:uncharacterized protein LOC131945164 [Physella acuta]|uniref:uncharacterized protein LOC131945164 n=1 Tax=Physella acuta TaxID=109671 RepID=UPI0027DB3503|nr:uncharacterized protein LOC131945164 [Physella acuta]